MIRDLFEAILNIIKSRIFYTCIIIVALFSILFVRLFNLQIFNEEYYTKTYIKKAEKTIYNQATRGLIYDRNGNILAYNELTYAVTIEDELPNDKYRSKKINKIILNAIKIIEDNGDSVINDFGISVKKDGTFEYTITSESALKTFLTNVYGDLEGENGEDYSKASAKEAFEYLRDEKYEINTGMGDKYDLLVAMVRYKLTLNNYQKYVTTTLAINVSQETVAAIAENEADIKGVKITQQSLRCYNDAEYFAPIIGYTGTISEDQLATFAEDGKEYMSSDIVGKAGAESAFEYMLAGQRGSQTVFVDSTGTVLDVIKEEDSVTGNNVYLTVDRDLTKATYKLLEQKIAGIVSNQLVEYDIDVKALKNKKPTKNDEGAKPISVKQVYYQMINNNVLDISHFKKKKASVVEKKMYQSYKDKRENVIEKLNEQMLDGSSRYKDMSYEYQEYQDFIFEQLVSDNVIQKSLLDSSDEVYKAWLNGDNSLKEILMHCVSMNWIKIENLNIDADYVTSEETYNALVNYAEESCRDSEKFAKLIYYYCLFDGNISGTQICIALYDQGVLPFDQDWYNKLQTYSSVETFRFMKSQIESLKITPAQIALDPCSGSTVITDPNSGQVLALVTYPSYDNNKLSGSVDTEYWQSLVDDESAPLYNRALQTTTAPGSTFKMISAMTGLEENYITPDSSYVCTGEFKEIKPYAKCWKYPDAHGTEDLVEAIKDSCNYYFYSLAYEMSFASNGDYDSAIGLAKLEKYATSLGLNEKAGLELTESEPKFSTESSVRSAIGQGSHGYTCAQLARYVSTIANNGNNYSLSIFLKEETQSGKTVSKHKKNLENKVEVSATTWNAIHTGMRKVVSEGTVKSIYSKMKIEVAGKTGTAEENKRRNTHALFVGYAPYDNPKIAISTVIPYGDASSNASEVARDVIRYYFGELKLNDILNGKAKKPEVKSSHD